MNKNTKKETKRWQLYNPYHLRTVVYGLLRWVDQIYNIDRVISRDLVMAMYN